MREYELPMMGWLTNVRSTVGGISSLRGESYENSMYHPAWLGLADCHVTHLLLLSFLQNSQIHFNYVLPYCTLATRGFDSILEDLGIVLRRTSRGLI